VRDHGNKKGWEKYKKKRKSTLDESNKKLKQSAGERTKARKLGEKEEFTLLIAEQKTGLEKQTEKKRGGD